MDLDWIRAFVAIAGTGSINRAAQALHLSQPAVTRQVQHLEEWLDVALFDRRTKPFGLTPVGHERVVIVGARGAGGASVRRVPDLAEARWVLNPPSCGLRTLLTDALQRVKAPPRVAVEVAGFDLQLSFVARGIGLGLVPASVLARSRFRSKLETLHLPGFHGRVAIWSVRGRPPESAIPALAAFDEALARLLARGAPRPPLPIRPRTRPKARVGE